MDTNRNTPDAETATDPRHLQVVSEDDMPAVWLAGFILSVVGGALSIVRWAALVQQTRRRRRTQSQSQSQSQDHAYDEPGGDGRT